MSRASEKRKARVKSLLMSALSDLIRTELDNPNLGIVTITDIRLSKDLTHATVMIATVGGPDASAQSVQALESAKKILWNRLRDETDLRFVPQLHFQVDTGPQFENEIEHLLQTIPPIPEDEDSEEPEESDGEECDQPDA